MATEGETLQAQPVAPEPRARWRALALGCAATVPGGLGLLTVLAWGLRSAPAALTGVAAALPWLWLAGVAVSLALALALRRGRPRWIPFALAVLVWVGVWGRAWVAWRDTPRGEPLVVMSWNVQRLGFEDSEDSPALECVTEAVEAVDPDALVLLEVSERDVERLGARLGLVCEHSDYRGTGSARRGGLAACSRGSRWSLRLRDVRRFTPDQDWYYVFTELTRGGSVFNLLAVHLQPYRLGMARTADPAIARAHGAATVALLERIARFHDPTVVAGDFNSPRDASVHVAIRRHMTDAFDRAAWGPGHTVTAMGWFPMRIDYVYVTEQFAVTSARIPAVDCADHRPVVVTLGL